MTEGNNQKELNISDIREDLLINSVHFFDYNEQLTFKFIKYISEFINIPSYADNSRLISRLVNTSAGLDEVLKKLLAALLDLSDLFEKMENEMKKESIYLRFNKQNELISKYEKLVMALYHIESYESERYK